MKKFLIFFLSIAGLTAPLAADCDSCNEPYCGSSSSCQSGCCDDPCCTAWDGGDAPWGGFYIGGFGGYAWGRVHTSSSPASSLLNNHLDARGGLAGALVGWNYQWCDWVAGIEADFAWCNLKKSGSSSISFPLDDGTATLTTTLSAHQRFLGTVRARIGYNWCNTLLYATGGLAYGNAKYDASVSLTSAELSASESVSSKKTRTGWTVGAGIEKLIWCNWSVKLEYLYYDLGRAHISAPASTSRLNFRTHIHTLKAGINYHF